LRTTDFDTRNIDAEKGWADGSWKEKAVKLARGGAMGGTIIPPIFTGPIHFFRRQRSNSFANAPRLSLVLLSIETYYAQVPTHGTGTMKHPYFFTSLFLAALLEGVIFGAIFLACLLQFPPDSPPIGLEAFGDSGVEGLEVDVIAVEAGTFRKGDQNTPGGDNAQVPFPVEPIAAPEELPPPVEKKPEPAPNPDEVRAEVPPAENPLPKMEDKNTPARDDPPPDASKAPQLPGAPGGSQLPVGTPSKGGKVGSRTGMMQLGEAKLAYPREAMLRGIEGQVTLYLEISAEGTVTVARVQRSSGHRILDEAALAFGRSLRFIPARERGQPVAATAIKKITFDLTTGQSFSP
jgi:periplasmic protein TonB